MKDFHNDKARGILSGFLEKARGLPIGTINKYGEMKMPDGSWKWVKKKKGGEGTIASAPSKPKKSEAKEMTNTSPGEVQRQIEKGVNIFHNGKEVYSIQTFSGTARIWYRVNGKTSKGDPKPDYTVSTSKFKEETFTTKAPAPSKPKKSISEHVDILQKHFRDEFKKLGRDFYGSVFIESQGDKIKLVSGVSGKRGLVSSAEKMAMRYRPVLPEGYKYKSGKPERYDGSPMTLESIRQADREYDDRGYTDSEFTGEAYFEVVPK